ncbi:MAG: rhomboid family intramembrane serine protease [Flavobacteriales bacterium]
MASLWQRHWVLGTMVSRLIVVNVLVWIAVVALSVLGRWFIPALMPYSVHAFFLATTADPAVLVWRPWSVVTHMFTHAGLFHIFFNMWLLWIIGNIFQGFFGQRKLLAIYLMGGLVGFLVFFLLYNGSPALDMRGTTALGASAAVMAIFVATATYFPDMTLRLFLFGDVKLKYLALIYVLLDFFALNGVSNVGGHAGHLGGALYGFLSMSLIRKGTDLNGWMERLIDFFARLFTRGEKMRVAYRNREADKRRKSDEEFNVEKKARQERIDAILDKISRNGYDSLTKDEKDYLFRHGQDI